jgi:BirA family transcriptional regulator, biotin operon repressor / biotin---[acetyl-CoA-carboxylase] ligase
VDPEKTAHRVLYFESLDSTNEEALRQLAEGCQGPLWIVAGEQTHGRGRGGRSWHSPKGNLYASLLLRLNVSAAVATELSFVAALAAYDAIASQLPSEQIGALRLKWPNDVMLAGAKIAGILIESLADPKGSGLAAIIGIGINVSSAPSDTGRPATALGAAPADCSRVFGALAAAFESWRGRWDEGKGFASVREAWLARAHVLGEAVSVNLYGSSIRGTFRGVDERGALQLETSAGVVITLNAGDIIPAPKADRDPGPAI